MERIGASEAKRHLPRLLDRVARGENLTITRQGNPVALLVPVTGGRARAREVAAHTACTCSGRISWRRSRTGFHEHTVDASLFAV